MANRRQLFFTSLFSSLARKAGSAHRAAHCWQYDARTSRTGRSSCLPQLGASSCGFRASICRTASPRGVLENTPSANHPRLRSYRVCLAQPPHPPPAAPCLRQREARIICKSRYMSLIVPPTHLWINRTDCAASTPSICPRTRPNYVVFSTEIVIPSLSTPHRYHGAGFCCVVPPLAMSSSSMDMRPDLRSVDLAVGSGIRTINVPQKKPPIQRSPLNFSHYACNLTTIEYLTTPHQFLNQQLPRTLVHFTRTSRPNYQTDSFAM
jgi:hypothetical protein